LSLGDLDADGQIVGQASRIRAARIDGRLRPAATARSGAVWIRPLGRCRDLGRRVADLGRSGRCWRGMAAMVRRGSTRTGRNAVRRPATPPFACAAPVDERARLVGASGTLVPGHELQIGAEPKWRARPRHKARERGGEARPRRDRRRRPAWPSPQARAPDLEERRIVARAEGGAECGQSRGRKTPTPVSAHAAARVSARPARRILHQGVVRAIRQSAASRRRADLLIAGAGGHRDHLGWGAARAGSGGRARRSSA